jgi:ectoine hydroxylase-related dioxygenase (phytanoyl-CoA dioxygenase family)
MLTTHQLDLYRAHGFVLGPPVLTGVQVQRLCDETQRVIRDHGQQDVPQPVLLHNMGRDDSQAVWQIVNIWQASRAFQELVHHPAIVAAAAQLLGGEQVRLWHDQIQYKPAGTGGVNMWHQDGPYWPILHPQDQQVTAWIALDEAAEDNGCMSMVPGSHLWGRQIDFLHTLKTFDDMPTAWQERRLEARLCPVPAGSVHFHHSLTWHASNANRSGRPRRAIALHFMNNRTCYHADGGHPMKPYVTVADGQVLEGPAFPLVWDAGRTVGCQPAEAVA